MDQDGNLSDLSTFIAYPRGFYVDDGVHVICNFAMNNEENKSGIIWSLKQREISKHSLIASIYLGPKNLSPLK